MNLLITQSYQALKSGLAKINWFQTPSTEESIPLSYPELLLSLLQSEVNQTGRFDYPDYAQHIQAIAVHGQPLIPLKDYPQRLLLLLEESVTHSGRFDYPPYQYWSPLVKIQKIQTDILEGVDALQDYVLVQEQRTGFSVQTSVGRIEKGIAECDRYIHELCSHSIKDYRVKQQLLGRLSGLRYAIEMVKYFLAKDSQVAHHRLLNYMHELQTNSMNVVMGVQAFSQSEDIGVPFQDETA